MLFPFYLSRGGSRISAATLEEEFNMAFPWDAEENFETGVVSGTGSIFTGVDDTNDPMGRLSVVGPQDAHEIPPYLGGYVLEVDLGRGVSGSVPDAFVTGNAALNMAAASPNKFARLMLRLSPDLKLPNPGDSVRFLRLNSGTLVEEASVGLVRGNKGEVMLGIFSPSPHNFWIRGISVERDKWLPIELAFQFPTVSTAEIQVYCMGHQVVAHSMAWATPLTSYQLGAMGQSLDIRGKYWFDHWIVDEERLVATQPLDPTELDGETIMITKSGYVFVGAGEVDCLSLIPMTTGDAVNLFDTDRLPYAHHDLRMSAKAGANETVESKGPRTFKRGCYAVLSGTVSPTVAPSAIVRLGTVTEYGWGAGGEEGSAA